ncbi:MAG: paraquat-inducible protein A [Pirellulales bacterium]
MLLSVFVAEASWTQACTRCSAARCFAAGVGGLVLYFPAILLPILEIEKLGHHHRTSLLGGTWDLIIHGNLFVGLIVLTFSIVLPLEMILVAN